MLRYLPQTAGSFNYDAAKPKRWPCFELNPQPDAEELKADEVEFDGPIQPREKFFNRLVKAQWHLQEYRRREPGSAGAVTAGFMYLIEMDRLDKVNRSCAL